MVGLLLSVRATGIGTPDPRAGIEFHLPAHPAEDVANVEGFRGLLGRQPLVLLARRAVVLSNGVLDEVLDALEIVFSHWRVVGVGEPAGGLRGTLISAVVCVHLGRMWEVRRRLR